MLIIFFIFYFSFICIPSIAIVCPQGWTYYGDKCWLKSTHESSWVEADSECRDRYGASLATIQNSREAAFISKLPKGQEDGFKFFDEGVVANKDFIDCFAKTESAALLGASVMSPSNIKTAEDCLEECAKSQDRYDQICKSVLWYKESKECVLNDKTKNDTDAIFVEDPEVSKNIDYYEKFCDIKSDGDSTEGTDLPTNNSGHSSSSKVQPKGPNRKEITGIRSCFSKFKHSSLVGFVDKIHDNVTERECLSECWKCEKCLGVENDPCKSVTYYPSAKQCILAKESRRNHIDYFDQTEPLAVFLERRHDCLFEMCEDLEINLIFAIDGSAKMNFYGFNRSLHLVDQIVSGIHEVTEFWKITVVQVGTEGPAVVEIDQKSFDTLDDFRRNLALIGWRRSPGSRLGDSLVDVADLAMKYSMMGESDFVWMITLSNGFSDDKLDDFEVLKNTKTFTSFSIGVGSDLDYVNLQKIATSTAHLIHSQDMKTIVKEISTKLCPKNGHLPSEASPPSSIPPDAAVINTPKISNSQIKDKDAYRIGPLVLHDETITAKQINEGVRTRIVPSTIAFMGEPRDKKVEKFRSTKLSDDDIHSIAREFWKSSRNDSSFIFDDDEKLGDEVPLWIGLKRGDLGKMEWSDGSRLDEFEMERSKHLEIEVDKGDCIKQNFDGTWSQENCTIKLPFACSMRPIMTINEKLSKDFEKAVYRQQKTDLSSELTSFDNPETAFKSENDGKAAENSSETQRWVCCFFSCSFARARKQCISEIIFLWSAGITYANF